MFARGEQTGNGTEVIQRDFVTKNEQGGEDSVTALRFWKLGNAGSGFDSSTSDWIEGGS
jgi:hypothetical protein